MRIEEQVIRQITVDVWASMIGVQLDHAPRSGIAAVDEPSLIGFIEVKGEWDVQIVMVCSESAAREAASRMFGRAQPSITPDEVRDAVAELTNIVGGNIKGLLCGDCVLSIPEVLNPDDRDARIENASSGETCLVYRNNAPIGLWVSQPVAGREPVICR